MNDKNAAVTTAFETFEYLRRARDFGIRYLKSEDDEEKEMFLHHVRYNLEEALALIIAAEV